MLVKKFIIALALTILLPTIALADISCEKCEIGNCVCEITDCDSGIFDVFSSTCAMEPDYEYIFSGGYLKWYPEIARSYYVKVLCSDGETQSDCFLITVKAKAIPTTTTTITRLTTTTTTTLPEVRPQGPDYLLWALIAILIIAILFAIYYFFIKKGKRGRKTYEELYKKWGRGR
jgi:hypothetical protein